MAVLTIRDVPDDVKDALAREARESGKSLQSYVLDVLKRQAGFSRNRHLLLTLAEDMKLHGGTSPDAPNAADVLAEERARRDAQLMGDR